jgi:ribonuclease HI
MEADWLASEVGQYRWTVDGTRRSCGIAPAFAMPAPNGHYLLYSEASSSDGGRLRCKFVLQSVAGDDQFSASDVEASVSASRLELLAVVRGLEALDHPSRVTLLTCSRYVTRGIQRELGEWRERGWCWERFGKMAPIRDHDLWQRIDRALEFHDVTCWNWQVDSATAKGLPYATLPAATATSAGELWQRVSPGQEGWSIASFLGGLRRGVLTPFSSFCRPAFTPAA